MENPSIHNLILRIGKEHADYDSADCPNNALIVTSLFRLKANNKVYFFIFVFVHYRSNLFKSRISDS